MSKLDMIAAFPFLLHMLTSFGVMYRTSGVEKPVDALEYWMDAILDCYRLGPFNGPYFYLAAYVQGILPIIAFILHCSSKLQTRKLGYLILTAMYFTTQLRLVMFGHGPEVISYLYINIVAFSVVVLFNDNKPSKEA